MGRNQNKRRRIWKNPGFLGAVGAAVIAGIFMIINSLLCTPGNSSFPIIERTTPVDPIAGAKLEILGKNFPDNSSIDIDFGGVKVNHYYKIDKNYLEIRVPENATSGPLHLSKRRRFLPNLELFYPIVSVQQLKDEVVLLNEDIRIGKNKNFFQILFSVLNTTANQEITINDIRLEFVVKEDLGSPSYKQERIDLGIASIFKNYTNYKKIDLLEESTIHLLTHKYVIKLKPNNSEALYFRMQNSSVQHNVHIVFVISIDYYNSKGLKHTVFSNRFFNVITGDLSGFSLSGDIPLNEKSFNDLKNKHGKYFRDIRINHDS